MKQRGVRKPVGIFLALLVVGSFAVVAAAEIVSTRNDVTDWTAGQAAVVATLLQDAVDEVIADVEAVAAFVEEIGPDPQTFESFTNRIEGTDSAVGYGYLTAVPASEVEEFVAAQTAIHGDWYQIFGFPDDESSDDQLEFGGAIPTDLTSRDIFYPVQAFAVGNVIRTAVPGEPIVGELALGLDAGFDPRWRTDIATAISRDGPSISQFITLQIDVLRLDRVFFVSVPVADDVSSGRGMVMAMMLEPLLVQEIKTAATELVEWEIVPAGASPARVTSEHSETFPVALPGTVWSISVAPTAEALTRLGGLPWWSVAGVAALVVLLASLASWLFVDRRTEHRRMAQLEQVAEDKDRFLASVSHELRTPLTVVAGLAYELHERPDTFSDEDRSGMMSMLVEQTNELSGIVEDLLVAARSDIGRVSISYEAVDLGGEARRAMESSGIQGTFRGDPGFAYADPARVRQILRNLLTNAKRYGGPDVRFDFAESAGWTEVVVADNGDGVPRDKREAIFQSYESAHQPSSQVKSVGLGLYISRNLARAMGGDLEYVYDGTWSHFRLRLPSAPESTSAKAGVTRGRGSDAAA